MKERFLVLRSRGFLWAVNGRAVTAVVRDGARVRVTCAEQSLAADEVVGLSKDLNLRPPGRLLPRLWPHRCLGIGVASGLPVVAVDPSQPPPALLGGEREAFDGD